MEKYEIRIMILLIASVLVLLIPGVVCLVRWMRAKPTCENHKRTTVSRILQFSGWLLVAVWCLRYAVGYFSIVFPADPSLPATEEPPVVLTWWEEIFNSMLHALQTFSMDEDYTGYIQNGKAMMAAIFGENSNWETAYGLYASLLNVAAPIAGGAIIFEILASIFPQIRLRLSHLLIWKEKYYFSKLNDPSLVLAQSICNLNAHPFRKPVIVFSDVYTDGENEKGAEMLLDAKRLGAICVKDDLAHVRKNRFGKRKYFLIDESETGNLQMLAELANSASKYLKKSEVFLFTNDDAYIQVEKSVSDRLRVDLKFTEEELPVFVPVKNYRNLISGLLVAVPLYEPLIGKKPGPDGKQTLTVTILGTGSIGMEMFLSTYWLGQILNCSLKINILSQETEEQFWSKIDYVNPEIRHTTIKDDPILRINRKGDMADVYCEVNYFPCDVKSSKFVSCLQAQDSPILQTDYFLVALGTDEDNISVANTVKTYIGQYHIRTKAPNHTVIAYVVYDSELSNALNRKRFFSFVNGKVDVYMQAIGSLHDVYSVRNVFLTDHEPYAQKAHEAYVAVQNREDRAKTHKDRMKDDYKHWASLARGMHVKYKVYSMGMLTQSLFDHPDSEEQYRQSTVEICQKYKQIVSGNIAFQSPNQEAKHLELLHRMAWLEHRRWNAFTRIKGFRGTTDYDTYAVRGVMGSYKQMDLKLHPCLVECDQKGIKAAISAKGIIDADSCFRCKEWDDFDRLDDLSYDLYRKQYNNYDFKQYDYPIDAF